MKEKQKMYNFWWNTFKITAHKKYMSTYDPFQVLLSFFIVVIVTTRIVSYVGLQIPKQTAA